MDTTYCQSCGMPLAAETDYGTNSDMSPNDEFCHYCFQNGEFTQDVTMEQMIEHCADYVEEFNKTSEQKFTREEAIEQMGKFFPHLKRWNDQPEP